MSTRRPSAGRNLILSGITTIIWVVVASIYFYGLHDPIVGLLGLASSFLSGMATLGYAREYRLRSPD